MTIAPEHNKSKKFVPADWQLFDLGHLAERHNVAHNSANWSEMGCFKTSSVLWLAQHHVREIEHPSILIITSPSGKGTYYEAIPEILPEYTMFDVTTKGLFYILPGGVRVKVGDKPAQDIRLPHIFLANFHVFMRANKGEPERNPDKTLKKDAEGNIIMKKPTMCDHLLARKYDFMAIDEAHRIKNRKTKWSINIKKIEATEKHVMTGTGFVNRPDEIWSLLNFLDDKEFSSYWRFRDTYCQVDSYSGYEKVVGLKKEKKDEFRALVREIGVRRTLTEVMPHIKEPIFVKRPVELNPTQRKMYDEIKNDLKMLDQKGVPIHAPNVISALNRMRQIAVATPELVEDKYDPVLDRRVQRVRLVEPSSKLDEVMELLEELQWDEDAKQQVVVFSNFKDPLKLLKVRLEDKEVPYIHMEESDNDAVRYHKWKELWPTKEHQVFMATLQLGSESINLSTAQHIVFLDRSWSPKDNQQGIGRVRRPGQEGQPVVINIEAERTTDQKLEKTNYDKMGWFHEIFGAEEA